MPSNRIGKFVPTFLTANVLVLHKEDQSLPHEHSVRTGIEANDAIKGEPVWYAFLQCQRPSVSMALADRKSGLHDD